MLSKMFEKACKKKFRYPKKELFRKKEILAGRKVIPLLRLGDSSGANEKTSWREDFSPPARKCMQRTGNIKIMRRAVGLPSRSIYRASGMRAP